MSLIPTDRNLAKLIHDLKRLIQNARRNVFTAVNTEMLRAYFDIGRKIVEEEQKGKGRAEYGESLINSISRELVREYGSGFDASNLRRMRQFYSVYRICGTLSHKSTWSHYCGFIKIGQVRTIRIVDYANNALIRIVD